MNHESEGSALDFNSNRNLKQGFQWIHKKELMSSKKFKEKIKEKFVFAFAFAQCKWALNLMNRLYVVRMNLYKMTWALKFC